MTEAKHNIANFFYIDAFLKSSRWLDTKVG